MQAVLYNGRKMVVVENWEYFLGEKFYCPHAFAGDPIKCNNNLFNGPLSRTIRVGLPRVLEYYSSSKVLE